MPPDCDSIREDIDAWAIGALDADDARALDTHIAGCAACARLADAARDDAGALALAVPIVGGGPALKARIIASAAVLTEMPKRESRGSPRRWWASAAAAVIVGAGLLGWVAYLQSQVGDLKDRNAAVRADATAQAGRFATVTTELQAMASANGDLARTQDVMLELMSQPDVRGMDLAPAGDAPSATARYVWSRSSETGALVARDLPPLPEGQSYCMWLVYENAWVVGGIFRPDADGTGHLIVQNIDGGDDAGRGRFRGFAVTIEPSTGAQRHTGPTILQNLN
jgi:hypothetical protein